MLRRKICIFFFQGVASKKITNVDSKICQAVKGELPLLSS